MIENIIAIVLVSIITTVVGVYIVQAFKSWAFISSQKGMAFSNSSAMYKVLKEIKTADRNTNILTFTADQLSYKDTNNNTITYSQNGYELLRNSDVLLNNLKNPGGLVFTYLDSNEGTAITKDTIRVIKVKLSTLNGTNQFILESAARLRIQ